MMQTFSLTCALLNPSNSQEAHRLLRRFTKFQSKSCLAMTDRSRGKKTSYCMQKIAHAIKLLREAIVVYKIANAINIPS